MPLTYQVLRCFKCLVFQVHPTKEDRRWACKMCNQKQSVKRFYSLGTAKECRLHVQTLNAIRGEIEDSKCTQNSILSEPSLKSNTQQHQTSNSQNISEVQIEDSSNTAKKSKWEDFLDANNKENQQTPEENTSLNTEVVSEQPKKKLKKTSKNKCSAKTPNKNNRLSPAKLENNLRKGNPIDSSHTVSVIYKAKPKSQDVSGSNQCKPVNQGFPAADKDLSWIKFAKEYNLNDPCVDNDQDSQSEPSEWFSTIDDDDLDTILEF